MYNSIYIHCNADNNTINVLILDESNFYPPSEKGEKILPDIYVTINDVNGTELKKGYTNSYGNIKFFMESGNYTINAHTTNITKSMGYIGSLKTVNHNNKITNVTFNLALYQYNYEMSGLALELNYIDLDTSIEGYQNVLYVLPGQSIQIKFSWFIRQTPNIPVWHIAVFGEWAPNTTLGYPIFGGASPRHVGLRFETLNITAPSNIGEYRLRMIANLDYDWPLTFYTGSHYYDFFKRDMGHFLLSKNHDGPFSEGNIIVTENEELKELNSQYYELVEIITPRDAIINIITQSTLSRIIAGTIITSICYAYIIGFLDDLNIILLSKTININTIFLIGSFSGIISVYTSHYSLNTLIINKTNCLIYGVISGMAVNLILIFSIFIIKRKPHSNSWLILSITSIIFLISSYIGIIG